MMVLAEVSAMALTLCLPLCGLAWFTCVAGTIEDEEPIGAPEG